MSAALPGGSQKSGSEKDFEFVKPVGRPIRRKRPIDTSKLDDQPPSTSSRKENRETLDVFTCVGVLYYIREHGKTLRRMYTEINKVTENCRDADFTVNIAKAMTAKLNNASVNNMISVWEEIEQVWQTKVQDCMACYPAVKKASERYISATNCFLSIWEVKNEVLDHLSSRLHRLLNAVTKGCDRTQVEFFKRKVIQAFSLEDEVSNQIVSQQNALITLTLNLLSATHSMDPCGNLQEEWLILRDLRDKVKGHLMSLDVDFEKEMELAREKCGDDVSSNNTAKELCFIINRWQAEYNTQLKKAVEFFVESSRGENEVDGLFTKYLIHRITKREQTPPAIHTVIKLLCQRGTGGSFSEGLRAKYSSMDPTDLKKCVKNFKAQSNLWNRLEAVKFAQQNSSNCEFWGVVSLFIKQKRQSKRGKNAMLTSRTETS